MRGIQTAGKMPMYLGVAVAILLVVLLSSFTFAFFHFHQESQASIVPLRPGWKQIAVLSGSGSTSLKQHIALPSLWGDAISCTGQGSLDIAAQGVGTRMSMGKHPCSTPSQVPVAPQAIEYDTKALDITTLNITADPTTAWRIAFVQEEKPSTFHPGPGWSGVMGMGSVGSPVEAIPSATVPASKIWGLVGVCIGDGTISATFTPGRKMVAFPACDGEPRLMAVRYSSPTMVQDVEVTPSSEKNVFFISVVHCVDEQQCNTQLENS